MCRQITLSDHAMLSDFPFSAGLENLVVDRAKLCSISQAAADLGCQMQRLSEKVAAVTIPAVAQPLALFRPNETAASRAIAGVDALCAPYRKVSDPFAAMAKVGAPYAALAERLQRAGAALSTAVPTVTIKLA
jgi:hypothetical protein